MSDELECALVSTWILLNEIKSQVQVLKNVNQHSVKGLRGHVVNTKSTRFVFDVFDVVNRFRCPITITHNRRREVRKENERPPKVLRSAMKKKKKKKRSSVQSVRFGEVSVSRDEKKKMPSTFRRLRKDYLLKINESVSHTDDLSAEISFESRKIVEIRNIRSENSISQRMSSSKLTSFNVSLSLSVNNYPKHDELEIEPFSFSILYSNAVYRFYR